MPIAPQRQPPINWGEGTDNDDYMDQSDTDIDPADPEASAVTEGVDVPPTDQQVQQRTLGWRQVLNRFVADQDTPLMLMTMSSVLGRNPGPEFGRPGHIAEAVRQGMVARQGARDQRVEMDQKSTYNKYLQDNLGVKREALQVQKNRPPARDPAADAAAVIDAKIAAFSKHAQKTFNMTKEQADKIAFAAVAPAQTPEEAQNALTAALQKIAAQGAGTDITNPLAPPDPQKMAEAAQDMENVSKSMRLAAEKTAKLKKMGYEVISTDYKAQTVTFKNPKDGSTKTLSYAEKVAAPPQ